MTGITFNDRRAFAIAGLVAVICLIPFLSTAQEDDPSPRESAEVADTAPARLAVSANVDGADIVVDGQVLGQTILGQRVEVETDHQGQELSIRLDGHRTESINIELSPGRIHWVAAELAIEGASTTTAGIFNIGNFCNPANVREVVNSKADGIGHCFERQLQTNPRLRGDITVRWRIHIDGSASNVSISESTMGNQDVENCIVDIVNDMRFEEPNGGICAISYPFIFTGLQ